MTGKRRRIRRAFPGSGKSSLRSSPPASLPQREFRAPLSKGFPVLRSSFRVSVYPGFAVLIGSLFFLNGLKLTLPFLISAAMHESGHLLVLRLLGIRVYGLELRSSGAVIRADLSGELREVWAAAAGPAVNLLLCCCICRFWPELWLCSAVQLLWNLLPVWPLDGGRICRLLLPRLFGAAGLMLCKLLAVGTAAFAVIAGIWASFFLRLGVLPVLLAGIFLLRLPPGFFRLDD